MTKATLIQWVLWGVTVFAILVWLERGRYRVRRGLETRRFVRVLTGFTLLSALVAVLDVWARSPTAWSTNTISALWLPSVIGIFVVSRRLNRRRFRQQLVSEAGCLVQPLSTFIIGLIGFSFFAALAVISNVWVDTETTWWTTAGFIGLALSSLLFVYMYLLEKHEISDDGLIYRTLTGRKRSLRWSELYAVRYARFIFRLETSSGTVVRISAMLLGLPEFARLLLQRVPPSSIEANTVNVLRDTAAGNPPQMVWI